MAKAVISNKEWQKIINNRNGYNYGKYNNNITMKREQASPIRDSYMDNENEKLREQCESLKLKNEMLDKINNSINKAKEAVNNQRRQIRINDVVMVLRLFNSDINGIYSELNKWYRPNTLWNMQNDGALPPNRIMRSKLYNLSDTYNGYIKVVNGRIEYMNYNVIQRLRNNFVGLLVHRHLTKDDRTRIKNDINTLD